MIAENDPHGAAKILEDLVRNGEAWDAVYSKLGVSYVLSGRRLEAIDQFHKAIEVNKNFIPAYHNLCLAYGEEEEYEKAVLYGESGVSRDPEYWPLYSALAVALKFSGRFDDAMALIEKARSKCPDDLQLLENWGKMLYESGRKDEAKEALSRLLVAQPMNVSAHRLLSLLRKYKGGEAHIAQLEKICASMNVPETAKTSLYFALGKAYEDMGDYERSSSAYKAANKSYRETYAYSSQEEVHFFAQIKAAFPDGFVAHHQSKIEADAPTPIFIVGMPRSGTSLVEQILATHSNVFGAGELGELERLQFKKLGLQREHYAQSVDEVSSDSWQEMAELYLKRLTSVSGGAPFVSDKMPQNFRYIGLIKMLFPNAKILHCMRDPRDTCLSIFKNYFIGQMPYAQDEEEIVEYYKLYQDLMAHWYHCFPGFIHDVKYESLVNDPPAVVKGVLEFCDLEWNEQCLNFHQTKRAVTTASALQVKKPIYKSALNYWENYAPYLNMLSRF